MINFLLNNMGTIITAIVVLGVISLIVVKMRSDKKRGKTSCGSGCSNCPSAGMCHKK